MTRGKLLAGTILFSVGMAAVNITASHADPTCFGQKATILGTAGDDSELTGTRHSDVIMGLGGNDIIRGRGGKDMICGGGGHDSGAGGPERDRIRGIESANGGTGNDVLKSSYSFPYLKGGEGDDRLVAGQNNDGHDQGGAQLFGGRGGDYLQGGAQPDAFRPGPGRDTVVGGDAPNNSDHLFYGNARESVTVDLAAGTTIGEGNDQFSGIERVTGSAHDDRLLGTPYTDLLDGSGGNDKIRGANGNDSLDGGSGSDTVRGGLGNDSCLNAEQTTGCETF